MQREFTDYMLSTQYSAWTGIITQDNKRANLNWQVLANALFAVMQGADVVNALMWLRI